VATDRRSAGPQAEGDTGVFSGYIFANAPQAELRDDGLNLSMEYTGWWSIDADFGLGSYSTTQYFSIDLIQNYDLIVQDANLFGRIGSTRTEVRHDNVSPFIEDIVDGMGFLVLNIVGIETNVIGVASGQLPINFINVLIESTNIVNVYQRITGRSDAEERVRNILAGTLPQVSIRHDGCIQSSANISNGPSRFSIRRHEGFGRFNQRAGSRCFV